MDKKNTLTLFLSLLFVMAIASPMLASFIQADLEVSESEKRRLQTWPLFAESKSITAYFNGINAYVKDHFGFRETLIKFNNALKFSLNESPVDSVIRGDEKWLFYKVRDPLMVNNSTPKEQVKANVNARAQYIKQRQQNLAAMGIEYQYMVVPNKMTLYSEFLPNVYRLTNINATYDYFKSVTTDVDSKVLFHAMDVLEPNKRNSNDSDLYFKNDTHWNFLGAYYAYKESMRRLQRQNPLLVLTSSAHEFTLETKISGDLAQQFTGLASNFRASEPTTRFANCTARSNISLRKENLSHVSCNNNDTVLYLVADSFISGIYAYMAESVGSLYMSNQSISRTEMTDNINSIKPDVVIEILVERSLARPLP